MQVQVSFRHVEPSDALKEYTRSKVEKVLQFTDGVIDAKVALSREAHLHVADINIINAHGVLCRAEVKNDDMYACIDKAVDKLTRQLKRYKEKIKRHKPIANEQAVRVEMAVLGYDHPEDVTNPPQVLETEQLQAKPMNVEEALMEMDLLDTDFLVFTNAETQKINIVHRRKDGTYGLIETVSQ